MKSFRLTSDDLQQIHDLAAPTKPALQTINWPILESQQRAADLLGWPVERIKQCKKAGCPAFRHSRIYLGEFIAWVGQQGMDDANIDWSRVLRKEQALGARVKRVLIQGQLIPFAEVKRDAAQILNILFTELERIFLNDQPAIAKGMDEYGLRAVNREHIEKLRQRLQSLFADIGAKEATAQTRIAEVGGFDQSEGEALEDEGQPEPAT